jgi:hypothetical protein
MFDRKAWMKKYHHDKYWADPERFRADTRKRHKEKREVVIHNYNQRRMWMDWLKDQPCMDCGGKFPPCAMEFDHVRGEKKFQIGPGILRSIKSLLDEIDKCDIVCSNCHHIRTDRRRTY